MWSQTHGVPFCPDCGTLLQWTDSSTIVECVVCHARIPLEELLESVPETTRTHQYTPKHQRKSSDSRQQVPISRPMIDEECPGCGNPQMHFYAIQTRSADEGQTVFYECPKCGFKFSLAT